MDPKLLYWTGALLNLGVIVACAFLGVGAVRRGDVRRHRAFMLGGAGLIALFLASYVLKVVWLGKEDRSRWTAFDHAVLYVHELCIAAMLLAGALALWRAWRFRGALAPGPSLPATPLPGGHGHKRAGRVAVAGAVLGFATAALVLARMFAHAGGAALPDPTARNLVMVSLDTLRADRLGAWGYERDTSPGLDVWAQQAFAFLRATSAGNATVGAHHALFQSRVASQAIVRGSRAPTLAQILRERGFRTAAWTDGGTMARSLGFDRGFERFDDANRGLATSLPKALPWLDEAAAGDAPFYLFVHSFDVHLPYDPPPPWDSRFFPEYQGPVSGPRTLPLLRGVRRIFEQANRAEPVDLPPEGRRKVEALYDGEVAKTDDLLARLLRRIDAPDLRDDTLVVILSDHGEEFWEHGSVLHSHTLYQELLHVPLLIRVPAWRQHARRIDARVSMLDVLPTLLELLAVPVPSGIRGRSLLPLMRGEALPEVPIVSEGYPFGHNLQAVTLGDMKLIRKLTTGRLELYDLSRDPGEQNDLAEALPEQRDRLVAVLDGQLPARPAASPEEARHFDTLPEQTRQRLRELGYIE